MKELLLAIPVEQVEAIPTVGKTLAPQEEYTNDIWEVPFGPPSVFVGRHDMYHFMKDRCLRDLDDKAAGHRIFVLHGLAGSGKTTLCVRFACEFREKFWAVFWIHSNSEDSVQMNLREIGNNFASMKSDDHRSTVRWLSNLPRPWLLIFDNADDPNLDLSAYFPSSNRDLMIVTSRNPDCARYSPSAQQEVKEMKENEACDLLLESMGGQGDASEALVVVKAVGFLALPIIHAAAYLRKGLCTMIEYPDKLAKKRKAVLNYPRGQGSANYSYDTYASLELLATHMQSSAEKDPVAAHALQLLEVMAFWHFEGISETIIENACLGIESFPGNHSPQDEKLFSLVGANPAQSPQTNPDIEQWSVVPSHRPSDAEDLNTFPLSPRNKEAAPKSRTMSASETSFVAMGGIDGPVITILQQKKSQRDRDSESTREAFDRLKSYSIISVQNRPPYDNISINPVTHMWMKDRMDDTRLRDTFFSAVWILGASIFAFGEPDGFRYRQSILPHIDSCLQGQEENFIDIAQQSRVIELVVFGFSVIYSSNGRYRPAARLLQLWRKVLMKTERAENHPQMVLLMDHLSTVYSQMGQYEDAVKLGELTCEVASRNFGEDDLRTIEVKSQLGSYYNHVGQFEKSVKIQEQCFKAMQARKKTSAENNFQMQEVKARLGACYSSLRNYEKGIEMGLSAFKADKKRFGEEDPRTLSQMGNLANCYHCSGNFSKATELQKKCLEIRKRVLGENHSYTLKSMSDLANYCYCSGNLSKATELQQKCLGIGKRVLGENHPNTLLSMNNLSNFYYYFGNLGKATELQEKCLEIRKKVLGGNHPDTLMSMNNLAPYYSELGRRSEAEVLSERCWEALKRVLGEEHPQTLLVRRNHIHVHLKGLRSIEEVVKLGEECLEAQKRILGEDHPDTLLSLCDQAKYYHELGENEQALELAGKCWKSRCAKLGETHPDTVVSRKQYQDLRAIVGGI